MTPAPGGRSESTGRSGDVPPKGTGLRVLVVARWYPAYDDTSRGRFVADHVAALVGAGVGVVVASFEPVFVRGPVGRRAARAIEARAAWDVTGPHATNTPRTWGARVPVARLPVVLAEGERTSADEIEAHAAALGPFARGLAARWPFDLVHAHTGLPDGAASLAVARRLGVPLVVSEHDSTVAARLADAASRAAYLDMVRDARVLSVSRSLGGELAGALGVGPDVIGVLPNPVDVDAFTAPAIARDPDELLYVGNRKASKGIETLLRAFASARQARPGLRLRLIGRSTDVAEEGRWQALAADLHVADAVIFEPPADRMHVAQAMARAAAFVHPSPRETFGVVAAEALAAGLPVAATPSGGVAEILGPSGDYGEVAERTDEAALAAAVSRVLDRQSSFDAARLRARARDYSPSAVAAQTLAAYQSVLEGRGRQGGTSEAMPDASAVGHRSDPFEPPPVLFGLTRPEVAHLVAALPPELAARLTVVTTQPSTGGPAAMPLVLPRGPRWVEIDPDAAYSRRLAALPSPLPPGSPIPARALAFLRAPRAASRRRRLFENRARLHDEELSARIREAWSSLAAERWADDGTERWTGTLAVALDGDAAVELSHAGAHLAPGSLRWLVDAWDEAVGRERADASSDASSGGDGG